MQITTYVQYLASITYTFTIFDKYIDPSDYGRTALTSNTVSARQFSNIVLVPQTSIRWRRQTFIKANVDGSLISRAAYRFTLNNNLQYVSNYDQPNNVESSNSFGILYEFEGSDIISSSKFYCITREYPANKYSFYKEYELNCVYYAANTVLIKSLPSHILSPNFHYDFIIYYNQGASANLFSYGNSNKKIKVTTVDKYASGTLQYFD